MHKSVKKGKWYKPKLLILTRGKPDEMILGGCKRSGVGGPEAVGGGCGQWTGYCNPKGCYSGSPS